MRQCGFIYHSLRLSIGCGLCHMCEPCVVKSPRPHMHGLLPRYALENCLPEDDRAMPGKQISNPYRRRTTKLTEGALWHARIASEHVLIASRRVEARPRRSAGGRQASLPCLASDISRGPLHHDGAGPAGLCDVYCRVCRVPLCVGHVLQRR